MSIDYWSKLYARSSQKMELGGERTKGVAKEEETRAPGLESQVMKGLDLFRLLNHPFKGQKAGAFTSTSRM